jgi:hypothetical protein
MNIESTKLQDSTQNPPLQQTAVSGWVRCSDCKYLRHEVRLGNPDGDIVECMQDSNENTFINDRNIYEKWHCDVFEPCR